MTKWDERFLALAQHVAGWSKDPSTKVGAIIVDSNQRVISLGYNGFARGVDDSPERLSNRDTKYKMTVHAEMNAILFAKTDLIGTVLYTWPFMPCAHCAAAAIQVGISQVIAPPSSNPRWTADFTLSKQMFEEAGVGLMLTEPNETLAPKSKGQL